MSQRKKTFRTAALFVMTFAGVCFSEGPASDFDEALKAIPKQPKWPSGIMYCDMEPAAGTFADKHADLSAVEFLKTKAADPKSARLAMLTLAKLAAASEPAEEALCELIYEKNDLRRDALTAIAYLKPNDGRRISTSLLLKPGPWEVRRHAAEMLAAFGNKSSLDTLKDMMGREEHRFVKEAIESAIGGLEYRLTMVPPDEQAEWSRQEILSWRTLRETPPDQPISALLESRA